MREAILIIDLQNCFIKKGNAYLPDKIRRHLQRQTYKHILFSQFINQQRSPFVTKKRWKECFTRNDTDIVPQLQEWANQGRLFHKTAYSALKASGLLAYIRTNRIKKLYLCGLNLHACVLATMFEAFDLGIDYELISNLTDIHDNPLSQQAKKIINKNL